MSIQIDEKRCIGCGRCSEVCPGNLIKLGSRDRAWMKHPRDCWGCTSCLKVCPTGAIRFFLGADIGGRGSSLTVHQQADIWLWRVHRTDGSTEQITVNKKDSNQY